MGPRSSRSVSDVQGLQERMSLQRGHDQAESGISAELLRQPAAHRWAI